MKNPWLQIPASDYEAHMALPEVAQSQALSRVMASALQEYAPRTLAVIGCATGNGFEHIDISYTRRVVGVDINPAYLAVLKSRFSGKIPGLELMEADVASPGFRIDPVSMVFAGLLFEYVDVSAALGNIARSLAPEAILVAVLQLPSPKSAPVTDTHYKSLELLAPIMNLVSPSEFFDTCSRVGLQQIKTDTIKLTQGKAFFVGFYRKEASQ
jgi:ubiquinone/menaquinone biosynthesis C-methylase UbiE